MRAVAVGFTNQFRVAALDPLAMLADLVTPLVFGVIALAESGRPDFALVAGVGMAGAWEALLVQLIFVMVTERDAGTLEVISASPTPLAWPLAGRLAGALVQALPALPVAYLLVVLGWGAPNIGSPLLAASGVLVLLLGFAAIGLVLTAAMSVSRYYDGMLNGLFPVTVLLGGLLVPLSVLPAYAHGLALALPPSWAMLALREHSWPALLVGLAVCAAWYLAGFTLIGRAERWLRLRPDSYFR